ncbi:hypothetical protein HPB47_002636 [Ixodes persulcatus]|uniref:Uncharacterized protein n=1 Tax=Ixodes persulcatus TaxID=34615 RepID=A0AC60PKN2_IXOPE|nr:hypothetical protein HPB47_002636 [Ixodes persulcatus]
MIPVTAHNRYTNATQICVSRITQTTLNPRLGVWLEFSFQAYLKLIKCTVSPSQFLMTDTY